MRQQVSSDGPYEKALGYSRAVRVGNQAFVAGTTSLGATGLVGHGDVEMQTRECLRKIADALTACGLDGLRHVVRTRVFFRDIEDGQSIGRVHGEMFAQIRPVTSFLAGIRFLHPDILVEIEADAVLGGGEDGVDA